MLLSRPFAKLENIRSSLIRGYGTHSQVGRSIGAARELCRVELDANVHPNVHP
jgi:hypothetical protein